MPIRCQLPAAAFAKRRAVAADTRIVSRFLENAVEIFDAAENSSAAGHELSDMTVLISPTGGIHLLADCDWPLDTLQAHRGARMVYRVSQQDKTVRLEGRAGSRTCLFETAKPDGAARRLLADAAKDLLRPVVLNPEMPCAAAVPLLPAAQG